MKLRPVGSIPPERLAELGQFVADQTTTERVFRAVDRAGLQLDEIIHQDEYTIDIVVALPDQLVLVYDTT